MAAPGLVPAAATKAAPRWRLPQPQPAGRPRRPDRQSLAHLRSTSRCCRWRGVEDQLTCSGGMACIRSPLQACSAKARAVFRRSHCSAALSSASLSTITPGCRSTPAARVMKSPTFTVTTNCSCEKAVANTAASVVPREPHVDHSFSRYARFTGPTRQAWAQVFINQELQAAGAQLRWRSCALRGRPGGLGMRA